MKSNNQILNQWVSESIDFYQPDKVVWYDGQQESWQKICAELVEDGTFIPLNPKKYPNSFWSKSNPNDVARVEGRTFICSKDKADAGPTNNWAEPKKLKAELDEMMQGCMKGRTMYVVPYLMGPRGSRYSKFGVELTDSPYVVANMHIMATTGKDALENLADNEADFVKGVHSYGNVDPEKRYIAHFPESRLIYSFNTNYGGNVLQGKKCFALRMASKMANEQNWMAEHMLILGITRPDGKKFYVAAAFPSACGKTNLAMLVPPQSYLDAGWKVETIGDDIAWLNFGNDGRLYAINPETGFFGVAPGTSEKNNPNALKTLEKGNTIFTNTAFNPEDNTVWWEGLSEAPAKLIDWKGNNWAPESKSKAAHANSRFTTPAEQCPCISDEWQNPEGVPISAIVFGGRRSKSAPLIYEAFNWQHGTFIGATMSSETTAAATGAVGEIRRDPMAMRPFIGYHVGDYFQHWLDIGNTKGAKLPKIFHVNWFRTDENNNFIWPGFGDNMRVLEWVLKRVENECEARKTELGYLPEMSDIDLKGLSEEKLAQLFTVNPSVWEKDIQSQKEFFKEVGDRLPAEIQAEHDALCGRLGL